MTSSDSPAHLLSLKVMRVSRPELATAWQPFYSSSPSFSAHSSASILSLQGSKPLPGHPKTLRDLTHATELLTLPASFGSIQLGETFSGCLCVNNETQIDVELAHFKVEMQTASTKVILYETDGSDSMQGGDTLERVVHHEIKELGQHVLACTVAYRLPPNFRAVPGSAEDSSDPNLLTFRKFYKFAVTNPLSVKTKVHSAKSPSALLTVAERHKIFLEVHIQNLTQNSIHFERMRLECTDFWQAVDLNMVPDKDGGETSIFTGSMALMRPQELRQYVYILTPKNLDPLPLNHPPGSIIPLGRLDISWRSTFGEPGRLLTSMLSRRIPLPPTTQQPPAPALPPYLKRTIASAPSRPQSPQLSQSRPGTPPAGHLPNLPAMNRPGSMSALLPNSPLPLHTAISFPLPELEADLIVRSRPRSSIQLYQPFNMGLTVTLSSSLPQYNKESLKRKVTLVIQHLTSRPLPPQATTVDPAPATEAFSPRLPSSGFSTPASAATTFNYALAHQKILAVSTKPQGPTTSFEPDLASAEGPALPPPYFDDSVDEGKLRRTNGITFVGPSTITLPPLYLSKGESDDEDSSLKIHTTQDFEVTYVASQTGFHTIGSLRILVVEDRLIEKDDDGTEGKLRRALSLKEHEVIGETWVYA